MAKARDRGTLDLFDWQPPQVTVGFEKDRLPGSRLASRISRAVGLALNHDVEWRDANGLTNRTHLYGIANVYYEFAGESKIDVAGTPFSSRNDRLFGGVGLGGSLSWADDKFALYGEAQLNTSLANFGDSNSIGGTVGFHVRW